MPETEKLLFVCLIVLLFFHSCTNVIKKECPGSYSECVGYTGGQIYKDLEAGFVRGKR